MINAVLKFFTLGITRQILASTGKNDSVNPKQAKYDLAYVFDWIDLFNDKATLDTLRRSRPSKQSDEYPSWLAAVNAVAEHTNLNISAKFQKKTTLFCPTTDAGTKGIVDQIKI